MRKITRPNCALDRRTFLCLYVPGFLTQIFKHVPKCKWIPLTNISWIPRTNTCNVKFVGTFVLLRIPQQANIASCSGFRNCKRIPQKVSGIRKFKWNPRTKCGFHLQFATPLTICGFHLQFADSATAQCRYIHVLLFVCGLHKLFWIPQIQLQILQIRLFLEQF